MLTQLGFRDRAVHGGAMWYARLRRYRVRVVVCTEKPGCYHWVIHGPSGQRSERSGYAFATAAGARASGRSWRRAFEQGQGMA